MVCTLPVGYAPLASLGRYDTKNPWGTLHSLRSVGMTGKTCGDSIVSLSLHSRMTGGRVLVGMTGGKRAVAKKLKKFSKFTNRLLFCRVYIGERQSKSFYIS